MTTASVSLPTSVSFIERRWSLTSICSSSAVFGSMTMRYSTLPLGLVAGRGQAQGDSSTTDGIADLARGLKSGLFGKERASFTTLLERAFG
jgi:hypothetical protein